MQNKLNKKRKHYSVKIYTKPNNMNNEQLNAAKDKAAQEAGYNTFNELISVDGYLSDNITLINRAMEIYAEGVMDKTVEDQKFLLEATYTEGIREGFEAARLPLIQEGRNCGDLYQTVDDYLNR